MDEILLIMSSFLSCCIITALLFQFMNERYKRNIRKKFVYIFSKVIIAVSMVYINSRENAMLNLSAWCLSTALSAYFLYYEDINKPIRRVLECEILVVLILICESLGAIVLRGIFETADIEIEYTMRHFLEVTISKITLIFLYYIAISRMMKKKTMPPPKTQYYVYAIMLVYSFVNLLVIVKIFMQGQKSYFCAVNMGCIILAHLYLLYYVKTTDEKKYYENQVKALEQQANIQYEYYLAQTRKHEKSVQILHDVKKHIKAIESLYTAEKGREAKEYADEIRKLLKPLIPIRYTGNPILNILLTDKEAYMRNNNILFDIKVDNINMDFIAPIDIITIFGNLLDNAVEAAEKSEYKKYVSIKIVSYRQMIVVKIENSCDEVKWKNGLPVSKKGNGRGLGILNVQGSIEKYDGSLKLKQEGHRFIAQLFLCS